MTLLELVIAVGLLTTLLAVFIAFTSQQQLQAKVKIQKRNLYNLKRALVETYLTVVEESGKVCSPDGWLSPYCDRTIPFPILENKGFLSLYLDGDLPAGALSSISTKVKGILASAGCVYLRTDDVSGSKKLVFACSQPLLTSLTYRLTDGSSSSGLSFGGLSPLAFPVSVEVGYDLEFQGETQSRKEEFSIRELYDTLKDTSARRMDWLRNLIRTYALTRLETEVHRNPYPDGLSSTEDFYVPWAWQVLATDGKIYKECGDSNCSGIDDWLTSSPSFEDVLKAVVERLGSSGLYPNGYDGFMWPWRIVLIGNGCSGNLSSCRADNNKPPSPNKLVAPGDYWDKYSLKPPYHALIYSADPKVMADAGAPEWERSTVVYDR
jgi:hypothetical protein